MKKSDYSIEELIASRSFNRMSKGEGSDQEIEEWSKWIAKSEKNREKVKEALTRIYGFKFDDPEFPDIDQKWQELSLDTNSHKTTKKVWAHGKSSKRIWLSRAAAILVLLTAAAAGILFYQYPDFLNSNTEQTAFENIIKTQADETKTVRFADGSKIILNSKSVIKYGQPSSTSQTLNVQLTGKAFFESGKSVPSNEPRFSIDTPNGVIQDIGTEFLINVDASMTRVVLQSGMAKIQLGEGGNEEQEISIEKGELVEFNSNEVIKRTAVNPTFFTSWATGFMEFDKMTIERFSTYLEENYNVKVEILDPELANRTLDGAVYFESLDGLIQSVSDVIKVPVFIKPTGNTIYIGTN